MSELTFNQKIITVQNELKAPKNQYNNFGKYKYRNQEDILEALKPLLAKYDLLQTISDKIIVVADRIYVEATVVVSDGVNMVYVNAFARESLNKKGQDESQITGTASSYARKYALNGMWLIDDTKDADTDEHKNQTNNDLAPDTERWVKAVHAIASGETDIAFVKKHYTISKKDAERLVAEALEIRESQ